MGLKISGVFLISVTLEAPNEQSAGGSRCLYLWMRGRMGMFPGAKPGHEQQ
jgi:hypothetical protein